ncbi:MAG TPA: fumarylacetoacetate hydrolase family protein [Xanthobacteraceae bacterium]|jgi:2-keto-4-pentenoate hydratase/2-oxohepta-3-ene-1,7-dioic acid hydratase in catechol pathway|nr:fumarylacetoacetate hydrolase family protein [Xanthobacteraceae bacterium]
MKLATFIGRNDAPAIGAVDPARGAVLDLRAASRALGPPANGAFADMLALIDAGPAGLEAARRLAAAWPGEAEIPLAGLRLLSPLPLPRQMRDCLVFEEHLKNGMAQREKRTGVKGSIPDVWYRQPIYYKCNRFSVAGPEAEVMWPKYSQVMDFELELACVIGRTAKDIARERALEHVFGFTIFNDFSARDAQFAEMEGRLGPAKGKDFDGGNVLGPWIVTRDEIGDPHALKMEVRVNGERWGGGNSGAMHHTFPDILAHISNSETLHAGEVIGSGTVGTGSGNEMGRYLKSGDVVELEIEKIGVLRNRVVRQ